MEFEKKVYNPAMQWLDSLTLERDPIITNQRDRLREAIQGMRYFLLQDAQREERESQSSKR